MKTPETPSQEFETTTCRLIAEFTDSAIEFVGGEDEFVPVPVSRGRGGPYPFTPPTKKEARIARTFWLTIIRPFTEAATENAGRLRIRGAGSSSAGRIVIERGTRARSGNISEPSGVVWQRQECAGHELDIQDSLSLVLFAREESRPVKNGSRKQLVEIISPIPWTEIVNIRFEVIQPIKSKSGKTRPKRTA